MMRKCLVLAAFLVAALCVVSTASADKRTLSITPTPVSVGAALIFTGCGYIPGTNVGVQLVRNTKTAEWIFQVDETVDATGCFSTADAPYLVPAAGKWTANLFLGDSVPAQNKSATLIFFVD